MTKLSNYNYVALGIVGAMTILYGRTQFLPHQYYIVGSLLLLAAAIHYRLVYFIALEIILAAGHSALLLGLSPYTQFALPILLCLQLLIFYIMIGKENSVFLFIGVIGIALLSIGFSYDNVWIFFCGSLFIAIYAYYSVYNGNYPSTIWAILNSIYALLALYQILFNWLH